MIYMIFFKQKGVGNEELLTFDKLYFYRLLLLKKFPSKIDGNGLVILRLQNQDVCIQILDPIVRTEHYGLTIFSIWQQIVSPKHHV